MSDKITAELIRQYGKALRRMDLSEQRAAEVAIEVERHNKAIMDAAHILDFNDEPSRFFSVLSELKEPAPARKAAKGKARK
jgi:hypothetical protein